MPYFVYKIYRGKRFELVERFSVLREARDHARGMRQGRGRGYLHCQGDVREGPGGGERLMAE